MADGTLSYHDLHITTPKLARTAISNLPFRVQVSCTRTAGWTVWAMAEGSLPDEQLGGEFSEGGLRLDVAGHVIVDTLKEMAEEG